MENLQITDVHVENFGWALGTIIFIAISSLLLGYLAKGIAKLVRQSEREQDKTFWGFTFAGPWLIGFIIFVVGPAIASLLYSFSNYDLGDSLVFIDFTNLSFGNYDSFWVELDNYRDLLINTDIGKGRIFKQALFNSFYYTLIGVPLQIIAALLMAMLLNRELPGISAFRTIYYLPVILAASPAALLAWRYMFTSNGGFVNNALQWFADQFFVFDWMYRYFIYFIEGFNGFYAGVAKGDSMGAFKYTLPAFIGFLILLSLLGEWDVNKRDRAYTAGEIMLVIILSNMLSVGLFSPTVNLSWTLGAGVLVTIMILVNVHREKNRGRKIWQYGGLLLFTISAYRTLQMGEFDFSNGDMTKYLVAMAIAVIPVIMTLIGNWNRQKYQIIIGTTGLLFAVMVLRAVPAQFGDGGWKTITNYATLSTTVSDNADEDLTSLQTSVDHILATDESDRRKRNAISDEVNEYHDYWKDEYPEDLFSSYWIYGAVVAMLFGLYFIDDRNDQWRKYLLYGGLGFTVLIGFNSFRDGQAYFKHFEDLKKVATVENITYDPEFPTRYDKDITHYHFVLFRDRTQALPSETRVPQWLDNELWTKPSLVLITMWSSGASMLIFLAALKGVPPSIYEAAEVDGANNIQKFFKITLPMISPAMFYNIVIGVIAALQTFEAIYIIRAPNESNIPSLRSAAYFLYSTTFQANEISAGAAASWILAAIILMLTVMQFRYSKWVNYDV